MIVLQGAENSLKEFKQHKTEKKLPRFILNDYFCITFALSSNEQKSNFSENVTQRCNCDIKFHPLMQFTLP